MNLTNMNEYQGNKWVEFRDAIIVNDGEECTRCGRGKRDGVVLQVHHTKYIKGLKPWEYSPRDCETVCKGCHAEIHGKIKPRTGWEYISEEDLEDLVGKCDYCGTDLRYLFTIYHEKWGCMEVGTICCDMLTESKSASAFQRAQKRREDRKKRFVESARWKSKNGVFKIKQMGFEVEICKKENDYIIIMNDKQGKRNYKNIMDAKVKVFSVIESGEADKYFKTKG
jgi:hypothetical protein